MLNRRAWLKTLLIGTTSLLLPNWLKAKQLEKFSFGKYVSHSIETTLPNFYTLNNISPYYRYVSFPAETTLTINFEKISYTYICFNVSEKIHKQIQLWNSKNIYDVLPFNELDDIVIENYKFKLSYISYRI